RTTWGRPSDPQTRDAARTSGGCEHRAAVRTEGHPGDDASALRDEPTSQPDPVRGTGGVHQGDPVREGTLVDAGGPRDERPGREPQIMDPDVVPASRLLRVQI